MQLLLLPGMDGCGLLFEPLIEALPPELTARTLAFPRGQPFGYHDLLVIVERAAAELDDFVVLGESFSGPLALMLAAKRPAGLRGVVLCATFVRSPLPFGRLLASLVRPWMFRWKPRPVLQWILMNASGSAQTADLLWKSLDGISAQVLAARARAVLKVDATTELRSCDVPILHMRARRDRIVGPGSSRFIRRIRPDVRSIEIDGPHLILQTLPHECAAILADFQQIL